MNPSPRPERVQRFLIRFALAVLCAVVPASLSAGPIPLPQSDGTVLILEGQARRLVTLSPHLAELVFAAGAGDLLEATVEHSDYPEAAAALPRVGDAFRIDLERILALNPDLILAWETGNPKAAVTRLQALGLATWSIEIRRPEAIAETLEQIGRIAGTSAIAEQAAAGVRRRLAEIDALGRDRAPVRYFYQVDPQPLFTISGEHLISRSLQRCGGENVFSDAGSLAPQVTREAVIVADPAVLFAPAVRPGSDPLAQWREWPGLSAVRRNALHLLPADAISRATPRMLDAVATACRLLQRDPRESPHE